MPLTPKRQLSFSCRERAREKHQILMLLGRLGNCLLTQHSRPADDPSYVVTQSRYQIWLQVILPEKLERGARSLSAEPS